MRLALIFSCLSLMLVFASCGITEAKPYDYPEKYEDAVQETYQRSATLDRRIVTQDWEGARRQAFILVNLSAHLRQYAPTSGAKSSQDYKDYDMAVLGLHAAADHVFHHVGLHQQPEAIEWMDTYNKRFNSISTRFWTGKVLKPDFRPRGVEHGNVER